MTIGIRWLSVGPGSGYGDAGETYLTGLRAAGVPVTWTPLGWPSPLWRAPYGPAYPDDLDNCVHADIVDAAVDHDVVVAFSPPFWHRRLALEASGRRLVAYSTGETDRLWRDQVALLNRYERILVPSQFNAAVYASSGITVPVSVVPHAVRPQSDPTAEPRAAAEGPFVFYLINSWTTRKAILETVSAYLAAFSAADDVLLKIHTSAMDMIAAGRFARRQLSPSAHECAPWFTLAKAVGGRRNAPAITLSTRPLDRSEIEAIHRDGDCFVSLSRGEGWGLGAFDAAASGNPVVVTGWGGALDFLPADYPYFVDYELVPTLIDEPDLWWGPRPGEHWARARVEHATALFRYVFEHRDEARAWGAQLRTSVTREFSLERVTDRLLDALDT